MGRSSSRDKILAAAEKLVAREGAAHLTLDAVAEEAGISKGGLLYHFATKNDLIQAILAEHIECKLRHIEEQKKLAAADGLCSELEAHIRVLASALGDCNERREIGVGLLAAVANNPEFLLPFQDQIDAVADKIWGKRNNFDADAAVLWLAVEGLRFFTLLNHNPFVGDQRERVLERLIEQARSLKLAREAGSSEA